jgi:hypothetical protein
MFKLFGDRTIKKAVQRALEERIMEAQEAFNGIVDELNLTLKEDVAAAKYRHADAKARHAMVLADKVLGK